MLNGFITLDYIFNKLNDFGYVLKHRKVCFGELFVLKCEHCNGISFCTEKRKLESKDEFLDGSYLATTTPR